MTDIVIVDDVALTHPEQPARYLPAPVLWLVEGDRVRLDVDKQACNTFKGLPKSACVVHVQSSELSVQAYFDCGVTIAWATWHTVLATSRKPGGENIS